MNIRTIYMLAPAGFKTGGVELAHQLVKLLNDNDINSKIAYIGIKDDTCPINEAFREYVNEYIDFSDIHDSNDIVIIAPEIYTRHLERFEKAYCVIWWMSVDNYNKVNGFVNTVKCQGFLRAVKRLKNGKIQKKDKYLKCADLHLYQSEYARRFLLKKGIVNALPLSDYINDSYFEFFPEEPRTNSVLYNPKKGARYTKKLIYAFPEYNWIPIKNMTTFQVGELLRKSKVYIDFGNHPGKDRFPREAAISGCCIITGLRGAAENECDVNIPSRYKFPDKRSSIQNIGKTIQKCFDEYEIVKKDFDKYRETIKNEKKQFNDDMMSFVGFVQEL